MTLKLTIGADPEFFVYKKEGKDTNPGKIVPACGLFGGTKKSPVLLSDEGGYLEDGAAVEFNIAPTASIKEARERVHRLQKLFLEKFPDYEFSDLSSAHFDKSITRSVPGINVLGCDPDFWAWGFREAPQLSKFKGFRFAGGHIHIGIDPWPEWLDKKAVIKYLDTIVYAPFIYKMADPQRYAFYGFPGLYREKEYGVEYRSPDNKWCLPETLSKQYSVMVGTWDYRINCMMQLIDTMKGRFSTLMHHYTSKDYVEFYSYLMPKKGPPTPRTLQIWGPYADDILGRLMQNKK